MTRSVLPVGYGTGSRAYQVWDTDTNQFVIQNIVAVEDLITATGNFIPNPTGPEGRMGNKLITYLDGTYDLVLEITNINILTSGDGVPILDLDSLVVDLVPFQATRGYTVGPGTDGGLPIQINVKGTEGGKTITLIPILPGPINLPVNYLTRITFTLIPLAFITKFKI